MEVQQEGSKRPRNEMVSYDGAMAEQIVWAAAASATHMTAWHISAEDILKAASSVAVL